MKNKIVPIFYACDDAFVKYTIVSLSSMIKNASKDCKYKVSSFAELPSYIEKTWA